MGPPSRAVAEVGIWPSRAESLTEAVERAGREYRCDGLCEPWFSKERRRQPQITIEVLTE